MARSLQQRGCLQWQEQSRSGSTEGASVRDPGNSWKPSPKTMDARHIVGAYCIWVVAVPGPQWMKDQIPLGLEGIRRTERCFCLAVSVLIVSTTHTPNLRTLVNSEMQLHKAFSLDCSAICDSLLPFLLLHFSDWHLLVLFTVALGPSPGLQLAMGCYYDLQTPSLFDFPELLSIPIVYFLSVSSKNFLKSIKIIQKKW